MLPINYVTIDPSLKEPSSVRISTQSVESIENPHEKVIGLRTSYDERDTDEYFDYDRKFGNDRGAKKVLSQSFQINQVFFFWSIFSHFLSLIKQSLIYFFFAHLQPCAIVVLSNMQNPNMQSLLRKYRYDANGMRVKSLILLGLSIITLIFW